MKKWIKGLKLINLRNKTINFIERKKAIKLSADIAMASTRRCMTCWSCAIVAQASNDEVDKVFVEYILASSNDQEPTSLRKLSIMQRIRRSNKRVRTKKILNKSRAKVVKSIRRNSSSNAAKSMAKMLVKNRTKVLRNLVPGGELMDDISLVRETLDYLVSLQAQVDVMRTLVNVTTNSSIHQELATPGK